MKINKVCVYTANYGGYDRAYEPKHINQNVEYVYYTDTTTALDVPTPWIAVTNGLMETGPQMTARCLKTIYMPARFDFVIWHDANLVLMDDPYELINLFMDDADIALFQHPAHVDLTQEGMAIQLKKGIPAKEVLRQTRHYRSIGYKNDNGHYESGFIIRRVSPKIHQFNGIWWDHIQSFCIRDQMSLGYALWRTGLRVKVLPGSCYHSAFIDAHRHAGVMNNDNTHDSVS